MQNFQDSKSNIQLILCLYTLEWKETTTVSGLLIWEWAKWNDAEHSTNMNR